MEGTTIEILLIDDDLAEAGMIREMLSQPGREKFSVHHVRNLADGLGQLASRDFDIILAGLALPGNQGLETALAVRDRAKSTPIIVMALLDDEETALNALQSDIQDYLVTGELTGALLQRSIRHAIQRKRDTDTLRQSRQWFASFMLHLPAAAWTKDPMGRYVYGNKEHQRVFSMPLSEYSGKRDEEFLPLETARQLRENDERVLAEGESLQTTEILRQADGVEHHFIVTKFPIPGPYGRPAYVAGIGFDITERVRAEEALQKSERKLSTIFHAVPALISISTLKEGKIIDINETALETLGYRREEVVGRTASDIDFWVDPPDRTKARQKLAEQGSVRNFETRFRGKTGQIFVGLLSAEVIDIDGERCMLTLVRDITIRKQAEEEIERLNTELAARAAELEEANRELEAFNYTVAHDLRKPLTTINGYCQVIRDRCGNRLDNECQGYLQTTYEGTLRMNRLIDTLLKFSRLSHQEPRREAVDLSAMAWEVADELKHAQSDRRGTFRITEGITVSGDPGLLRVVLDNLLGNAWKYADIREEAVIEFGVTEIDGQKAWFVRDNGPGFAVEDAGQLFIPFKRLSGAEKQAGFGIGLATVERIIRRHGGRIWAEGEPGKGATFYFTLGR